VTTAGIRRLIVDIVAAGRDSNAGISTAPVNSSLRDLASDRNSSNTAGLGGGIASFSGRRSPSGAASATTSTLSASLAYVTTSFALIGEPQAFPVVDGLLGTEHTSSGTTSHAFTIPDHDTGDLIVAAIALVDGGTITDPGGWTQVYADAVSAFKGRVFYRVMDGSEGATVTWTSTTGCRDEGVLYCIAAGTHGSAVEGSDVTGTGTNPDPPSVTPSWGDTENLWMVFLAAGVSLASIGAYPTNYTERQFRDNTTAATIASAIRYNAAASEDPGTWTIASGAYVAGTVAVKPYGYSGTATLTNKHDTTSATGTVTDAGITGTVAVTDKADTTAVTGTETITGTSALTDQNDEVAATGTETFTGTSAVTDQNDEVAATAAETFTGTAALTNQNDEVAATGTETISGTSDLTNQPDEVAASGSATNPGDVGGSVVVTDQNDETASSGTVLNPITGTSALTDQPDETAASGLVIQDVTGTVAVTNRADRMAATGIGGVEDAGGPKRRAPYDDYTLADDDEAVLALILMAPL
jgi:hypothetical protein